MVLFTEGGSQASMPSGSHDEFLELCALSASGELSSSERKRLSQHLVTCNSCREAQKQFESLVEGPISHLAAEAAGETVDAAPDRSSSWSLDSAEAELFRRLGAERNHPARVDNEVARENVTGRPTLAAIDGAWRELWISYAAAILLIISLAFAAYHVGMRRRVIATKPAPASPVVSTSEGALERQISDLNHERELAQAGIGQRDRLIAELKRQLTQQSAELAELKGAQGELQEASVRKSGQDFVQQQAELGQKLQQAEVEAQSLRVQLEAVQQKSVQDNSRVASLQAKVDDLTRALEEKANEAEQDKQLLAHDRDIRELMGARDLYISEVYDVARSGETKKPFGRVFYTKEKSLVFYAYDLEQESGVRNASTFQAWGRRGPDWNEALNLGIFYEDNATKKRWVLKFNDPKTLAQIDAVFVTIEPEGGSRKPSGTPLLFAYLKMDPNHP